MDSPGVVIEVPAAAREAAERGPLLAACSSVVAQGDCTMSPEKREAIAIVTFQDAAGLSVKIEVRLRRDGAAPAMTETIAHFSERDPESERWQSLGLLIGAATGQLQAASAPPLAAPPAPAPRAPAPPEKSPLVAPRAASANATARGGAQRRYRVRVGPSIAVELGDVAPVLGAVLDAAFAVHELVSLRATVGYAHGDRSSDVTTDRVGFFAGLGVRIFRTPGGLHGTVVTDTGPVLVRAENATSTGERIVGASRVGFDLGQDFDWLTVGLTTSLQRDWSKTNIRVNGKQVGQASVYSVQWAAMLGLAF